MLKLKPGVRQVQFNLKHTTDASSTAAPNCRLLKVKLAVKTDVFGMKSPTEYILTAADRLHDKYTCNVCSALLNIRPVNVADMAYHYFLLSFHSTACQPPLTVTNPSQPPQPPICSPVHSGTSRQRSDQGGGSNSQQICSLHTRQQSRNRYRAKRCIYNI